MPAHRGQESWALIDDMFETMRERQGIGLAAPQVHEGLRLFVAGVDDPEANLPPVVMINPVVEPSGSATEEDWEGRLSIPDVRGRVPRAADVRVAALDRFGVRHAMTASGFPARVIQHETDHLDGVLFLGRMSSFESLTFLSEYTGRRRRSRRNRPAQPAAACLRVDERRARRYSQSVSARD